VNMANGTSKLTVNGPGPTENQIRSTIFHIHILPPDDGSLIPVSRKHVEVF
jgi:hypothetical protein